MQTGINRWAFPSSWPLDRVIEATARHGFDGLELNLEESGDLALDTSPEVAADLARRVREAGLEIPAIATGLHWTRSISSPDEAEREAGLAVTRQQIRLALAMGVTHVLVVPGAVDVFFLPTRAPVPYELAYELAERSLTALCAEAEAEGVILCIENVWNRFLMSPLEIRAFVDSIGSPALAVYFDVGNVFQLGWPDDWIRTLGARIARVHVKDFKRSVGTADGFANLEEGEIDWRAVHGALRSIGYDGWLTAELFPPGGSDVEPFLDKTARSLRRIASGKGRAGALTT